MISRLFRRKQPPPPPPQPPIPERESRPELGPNQLAWLRQKCFGYDEGARLALEHSEEVKQRLKPREAGPRSAGEGASES